MESKAKRQAGENQLRIEERRASLLLEKQLCDLAAELGWQLKQAEERGDHLVANRLLWAHLQLGCAVEEVIDLRNAL